MSTPAKLATWQYVNRSYDRVRAALHARASALFQTATRAATARHDDLAATLKISIEGFEVGVDVHLKVFDVHDETTPATNAPVTRVRLGWEAARATSLFPHMEATLSAWPLSATETQIGIEGTYRPPLGTIGKAMDALVFHRMAEATVHRFLEDVVAQLRKELQGDWP